MPQVEGSESSAPGVQKMYPPRMHAPHPRESLNGMLMLSGKYLGFAGSAVAADVLVAAVYKSLDPKKS